MPAARSDQRTKRKCINELVKEFYCSDCETTLPRAKFARAQLSKHKSDEDRLCRDCADLTRRKVEAIRLGEEYLADRIEDQMMERREGGSN